MRKLSLTFALLFAGTVYCKEIPSPFWYSISEKILTGTNQLISTSHNSARTVITLKVKPVKPAKPALTPLKCDPKKKFFQLTPFVPVVTDAMWTSAH